MAQPQTDLGDILTSIDRTPWLARVACFGLGSSMALGLSPFQLPLITVLALALALRLLARAPSRSDATVMGWLLGAGYFVLAMQWIVEPFFVDASRHGWMAPFALLLMSGGLALFWAAAAWVSWGMGPTDGPRRALAVVLALTTAEMFRSVLFTGYPWALIGSVWVGHPISQLAALGGVHGLTFFTGVLSVGVLTLSVWRASRRALLASGVTVLAWAGGTLLGEFMASSYSKAAVADGPIVRIVQPNEAQHLKWRSDQIPVFWDRKLSLTATPSDQPPDVVVWPEVSLPYLLGTAPDADAALSAAARGAPVIVGAQRFVGDELRNSMAVISDGAVTQVYDKYHLVPFGEYFPGGALARALGFEGLATDYLGGFSPGDGPQLLDLGSLGRVLPLICYEAIFPRYANPHQIDRPDWIVQVTNDAWFGWFAGPQQHLDQSRLRAIEQGLPVIRAGNTGISAVIDPTGRVQAQLALDTMGIIDHPIPAATRQTLFSAVGNGPLILLLLVVVIWLIRSSIMKDH